VVGMVGFLVRQTQLLEAQILAAEAVAVLETPLQVRQAALA
jgi:hypothetical protein